MDEKGGLYAGGKTAVKNTTGKGKSKSKSKKTALVFVVLVVAFIVIFIGMSGLPSLMIGAIDYNLQDALGFTDTTAILENQAEYVTAEMLALGEVPSGYAGDLAAHNLAVGQVTARGDFVRTDVYLAELDSPEYDGDANIVAAAGEFYRNGNPGKGELAVLFGDQLVSAGEFVAVVESSPEMYAAYAEAADISARYYYGEDVNAAYQDLGVVRGAFNSWTATGDAEKDAESFKETLAQVLDSGSTVTMNGYGKIVYKTTCYNEDTHATYECEEEKELKFSKNASGDGIISGLANESIGSNATEKAVELLNGAVSSSEPYLAANAFMAIEEPIQRARINGDGPVNELMNTISRGTVEEVKDAEGNVTETINHKSILETKNFVAAVSGGNYSVAEAAEFSRDRVLKSTGQIESDTQQSTMKGIINSTVINTDGKQKSSLGVKIQSNENKPDATTLEKAKDDIELGLVEKNSSTFQSEVGGNRIVEGGAFISSFLNQRAIGAMPSDEAAVLAYQERVDEVLARRAAAERATKSPLDASSRYTWLGSILHNFATTMLRHAGESGPEQFFGVVGDLITGAVSSDAAAAGEGADDYATLQGTDCATAESAANVAGDLYCTPHATVSTKYMSYTEKQWKEESGIKGDFDDNGNVKEKSGLTEFTIFGTERVAPVGLASADVCKRYADFTNPGGVVGALKKLFAAITDLMGLTQACDGTSSDVATGAKYTISSDNTYSSSMEMYSGYLLYDEVKSLLSDKKSTAAQIREDYYAKNPKDESATGVMAARTGISKEALEMALEILDVNLDENGNVIANK